MKITGYTIEHQIGQGGMAIVYRAIQESLGRPVALKVMNPLIADSPEFSERFLNEGRLLASLRHDHIMTIYDIGVCDGFHYISMEYVDGGDLKQRIGSGIALKTALDYVINIGSCLRAAHEADIVHRDVKPVNILFRGDGTLLLTDFGIAKQLMNPDALTATGSMMGTPYYLSPEQALGSPIDGRADIYSLGVVLYEMLVRKKPFEGRSEFDIILKQVEAPLPRLPQDLTHFQALLDKMTAKQPQDRFSDAASLLQAAQHLRDSGRWDDDKAAPRMLETTPEYNDATMLEAVGDSAHAPEQAVASQAPTTMVEKTVILKDQREALSHTDSDDLNPEIPNNDRHATPNLVKIGKLVTVVSLLALAIVIVAVGLPGSKEKTKPNQITNSQQVELDEQAEIAKQAELARQAEIAMRAELAEQAESARQVALAKQSEMARLAELEKQAELARQAEISKQAALAKQAELARQAEIDTLLTAARNALSDYRLTLPENDNAYHYYQKVLALDPFNRQAASGFSLIADRYYWLAKKEFDNGQDKKAKHYVDAGLRVKNDHPELLALRDKLAKQDGTVGGSVDNLFRRVKGIFN